MKYSDYAIAPEIKRSLEGLDFRRPTDIQYKAIPPILKGEDVLAIAQTGTGKTAAFAIPLIHLIHSQKATKKSHGILAIVMEPTRELAMQIHDALAQIGQYTKVKTACITGGFQQEPQIKKLLDGVDIVVATPGRVFDLHHQGFLNLQTVKYLVMDEADHMLQLGFYKDIKQLIRHLPKERQTIFISATINDEVKELAYSLVRKPIRIQLSPKNPVSKNVSHFVAHIEMDDKRFFLERLINENPDKKLLVFVRTKVRAERVMKALERVNISSETLHGDREQEERIKALEKFKSGANKILIATDVSARGIDVAGVDIVVNYDLPELPETYVHRIGRTGRGVARGKAFSFCSAEEKPLLDAIEAFVGEQVNPVAIDKSLYKETIDLTSDNKHDWKKLLKEANSQAASKKKKRKK